MKSNNVTCPFCGLLCDDLKVTDTKGQLKVTANGCPKAIAGFEQSPVQDSPRVNGKTASLDDAVRAAAKLLKSANQPLFAGLAVDVSGMRSVMSLADQTGAVVDHMLGEGLMRNFLAVQDRGWMMTTLTEIRNRAELIIFAGTDASAFPRFFEKAVWNKQSMFDLNTKTRDIVYLGKELNTKPGISPDGKKPGHIKCDIDRVGEVISALRAILHGHKLQTNNIAGAKLSDLEDLANRIKNSAYGVMVWAPGDLEFPHADHTVQAIAELAKDVNETTRFGGFSLGGDDGAITAAQVCGWQSGFPLRTSFATGEPVYDPSQFSTQRLLESGEADAMMWVTNFTQGKQPPTTKIPTIVVGEPGLKLDKEPAVFIPAGTIGLDNRGQIVRCDNVVSLRIRPTRSEPLAPSVENVLSQIEQAL